MCGAFPIMLRQTFSLECARRDTLLVRATIAANWRRNERSESIVNPVKYVFTKGSLDKTFNLTICFVHNALLKEGDEEYQGLGLESPIF